MWKFGGYHEKGLLGMYHISGLVTSKLVSRCFATGGTRNIMVSVTQHWHISQFCHAMRNTVYLTNIITRRKKRPAGVDTAGILALLLSCALKRKETHVIRPVCTGPILQECNMVWAHSKTLLDYNGQFAITHSRQNINHHRNGLNRLVSKVREFHENTYTSVGTLVNPTALRAIALKKVRGGGADRKKIWHPPLPFFCRTPIPSLYV